MKGFARVCSMHTVKRTGDIGIKNYTVVAPEFVVHAGLAMIYHTLICEFTEIGLYEQDLMGDSLPLHHHC